jgi:hypothetical protein
MRFMTAPAGIPRAVAYPGAATPKAAPAMREAVVFCGSVTAV